MRLDVQLRYGIQWQGNHTATPICFTIITFFTMEKRTDSFQIKTSLTFASLVGKTLGGDTFYAITIAFIARCVRLASLGHSEKIDGRCAIVPGDAIEKLIAGSMIEAERDRNYIDVYCSEDSAMHLTK